MAKTIVVITDLQTGMVALYVDRILEKEGESVSLDDVKDAAAGELFTLESKFVEIKWTFPVDMDRLPAQCFPLENKSVEIKWVFPALVGLLVASVSL